jgi:ArsR family transcriptional regulator
MATKDDALNPTLQVIADPTRRRILAALKTKGPSANVKGLCASDIEARMRLSQPTISHHMAVLEEAGLIRSAKQGQFRWYVRNEPGIRDFLKALKQAL